MKLASSSFYYQPTTDIEERDFNDAELRDHIERLQREFSGYGYRCLGEQLRREGIVVNDKKIRRVQRRYQLFPIHWQNSKIATTDSNHGDKVYPNLLAEKKTDGNQSGLGSRHHLHPDSDGVCLFGSYLDGYSRKIIG